MAARTIHHCGLFSSAANPASMQAGRSPAPAGLASTAAESLATAKRASAVAWARSLSHSARAPAGISSRTAPPAPPRLRYRPEQRRLQARAPILSNRATAACCAYHDSRLSGKGKRRPKRGVEPNLMHGMIAKRATHLKLWPLPRMEARPPA